MRDITKADVVGEIARAKLDIKERDARMKREIWKVEDFGATANRYLLDKRANIVGERIALEKLEKALGITDLVSEEIMLMREAS